MKFASILAAAGLIAASVAASPVLADPGNGKGHGKAHARHAETRGHRDDRRDDRRHRTVHVADCPPGLAKKNPPCVPPGQARKHSVEYGSRVGDVLRTRDYVLIRDPRRYDLESRRGWDYYQDNNSVYRVDSNTRKILAVINLIDAFSN
ncbi:hypothetical protein [Paracoccus sp. SSK6]|uniref:hypothetical protein n=1 Tax=Paracoccus sp. SSK6 TaxID=3143131 RepID=UPI00321A91A0